MGKLTLGCCYCSISLPHFSALGAAVADSIFTDLLQIQEQTEIFPSCEDCCDLLQNNLPKGGGGTGQDGAGGVTVSWAGAENKWDKKL